jgi:hypothetical protein
VSGSFEVDERHGVIGAHHDVEHVQIIEDHPTFVHGVGGSLDFGADPQGPGRVRGDRRRVWIPTPET